MNIQLSKIPTKTYSPVLSFCRQLISDGLDPDTRLDVYRGDQLALTVRSIGEGAKLTVQDNRYGTPIFRTYTPKKQPR